ncbi:hypothetical protein WN943_015400 [Citrus x changshan-huyou]
MAISHFMVVVIKLPIFELLLPMLFKFELLLLSSISSTETMLTEQAL